MFGKGKQIILSNLFENGELDYTAKEMAIERGGAEPPGVQPEFDDGYSAAVEAASEPEKHRASTATSSSSSSAESDTKTEIMQMLDTDDSRSFMVQLATALLKDKLKEEGLTYPGLTEPKKIIEQEIEQEPEKPIETEAKKGFNLEEELAAICDEPDATKPEESKVPIIVDDKPDIVAPKAVEAEEVIKKTGSGAKPGRDARLQQAKGAFKTAPRAKRRRVAETLPSLEPLST